MKSPITKPPAASFGKAIANLLVAMHRDGKLEQFVARLETAKRAEVATQAEGR